VAVVLLVLVATCAIWMWQRQRTLALARQREAAQKARDALGRGRALLEEGWQKQDPGKLKEARAEADRAVDVAAGADEEVRREAAAFQQEAEQRLARAEKNRALLAALLDVAAPRETRAYTTDEAGRRAPLDEPSVDEQYAAAFRRWGLDVDRTKGAEASARLKDEPPAVLQDIIAALDAWMLERRARKRPQQEWQRLRKLADRLDGGELGRQLRALLCGEAAPEALSAAALVGALAGPAAPWAALREPGRDQRLRLRGLRARLEVGREPVLSVVLLAWASQEMGDSARAESVLRQALAVRPDQAELLYALGKLLEAQGRPAEAVECFRAARSLRPGLGVALARALAEAGRAEEGEAVLRDLLRQQPSHPELHFYLGNALYHGQKFEEAEQAYRKAIALQPDFALAHVGLGTALFEQKKPDEAVAAFRKAIELRPDYAPAYLSLGTVLYSQKKPDEAEKAFRRAIDLRPDFAEAHYRLGRALHDRKKLDLAVKAYRRAIRLRPDFAPAHNGLGLTLAEQKRPAEAEKAFRKAIGLQPADAEAHLNLGNTLLAQNRPAEAERACRMAIELQPKFAEAHFGLGRALRDQKMLDLAIEAFRSAVKLRPDFAEAQKALAEAAAALGKRGR
jgi:tetratricopeptide (TPR) repeat protein